MWLLSWLPPDSCAVIATEKIMIGFFQPIQKRSCSALCGLARIRALAPR
jgi:hypothetical protein